MDPLESEDGQQSSESPADNENGSEQTASPAEDSNAESSTEEETQTSLEALNEALSADDSNESEETESGKKEEKTDEDENKDDSKSDDAKNEDENKQTDAPTDEELLKPLPEGTPEKTAERFEKLTDGYKSLKDQYETLSTESEGYKKYHEDFSSLVEHSGATAQEFNELIEYSHLVKSGNLEGALAVLDMQRADLAKAMGKPLPGVNLFESHPDLQEQIDSHELSEGAAAELVKARNIEEQRQKQDEALRLRQQNISQQQQSEEQHNQQIEAASNQVINMVASWEKNDINFSSKQAEITKKVEEIGKNYAPEQWAEVLQLHYNAIKPDKPRASRQHNPLRPGGGGGSVKKTPTSSLNALENALGSGN